MGELAGSRSKNPQADRLLILHHGVIPSATSSMALFLERLAWLSYPLRTGRPRMSARLNLLPDPAFVDLKTALSDRLEKMASNIHAEQFATLLDPLMR